MTLQKGGVFLEDLPLRRVFNLLFEFGGTLFAAHGEQVVEQEQRFEIELFRVRRALQDREQAGDHALEDVQGVGDQERADSGPSDDQDLGRLDQDFDVALLQ